MNSAFHIIINEIRKKYAGKHASMLDVFDIEKAYNLCSMTNIRNDNCAFLRITSFGLDEVIFEDVVTNLDLIKSTELDYASLDFEIKKALYFEVYGVYLEKDNKRFMEPSMHKPSIDFKTDKDEIAKLRKKCDELQKEVDKLKGSEQQSLFDLIDN